MITYATIALQLSTLFTLFVLTATAATITGVSIVIWLLSKLVEACWRVVEMYRSLQAEAKVWQSK